MQSKEAHKNWCYKFSSSKVTAVLTRQSSLPVFVVTSREDIRTHPCPVHLRKKYIRKLYSKFGKNHSLFYFPRSRVMILWWWQWCDQPAKQMFSQQKLSSMKSQSEKDKCPIYFCHCQHYYHHREFCSWYMIFIMNSIKWGSRTIKDCLKICLDVCVTIFAFEYYNPHNNSDNNPWHFTYNWKFTVIKLVKNKFIRKF